MDGSITVDFLAEGPPENPRLQGSLVLKDSAAKLVDGSSLTAGGRIEVGGHARLPELRGKLPSRRRARPAASSSLNGPICAMTLLQTGFG